jgi:lipid-binding SYLF domain-containing protein
VHATGFAIAHVEHVGWSAPLFMRLTRLEAGALLGAERLHALMAALTDRAASALADGVPQALGADFALDLWPLVGSEEMLDLRAEHTATIYGTTVDYATASTGRGVLLDASVARGATRPDAAKNAHVYGGRAVPSARAILRGGVPRPAELAPLYARIAAIARRAADR